MSNPFGQYVIVKPDLSDQAIDRLIALNVLPCFTPHNAKDTGLRDIK